MARTLSADAMADDALEILDMLQSQPLLSNAEVSLATSRANFRKWLASVRNRAEYGEREKAGVSLNVSIRQLHLDALRAGGRPPVRMLETGDAEIREAEVVEESPAPKAIPARSTD